jgi:hypothetical protein
MASSCWTWTYTCKWLTSHGAVGMACIGDGLPTRLGGINTPMLGPITGSLDSLRSKILVCILSKLVPVV